MESKLPLPDCTRLLWKRSYCIAVLENFAHMNGKQQAKETWHMVQERSITTSFAQHGQAGHEKASFANEHIVAKCKNVQLLQWQQNQRAVPAEWCGQGVQSLQALHAH